MGAPTCGFDSAGNPRTANFGYDCRVDSQRGLWGFCPSTVINASDCGLAGFCVDSATCSEGCGPFPNFSTITTFTCTSKSVCSTVVSDNGLGQSYAYIACGTTPETLTLYATPPSVSASTTQSSSVSTSTPPLTAQGSSSGVSSTIASSQTPTNLSLTTQPPGPTNTNYTNNTTNNNNSQSNPVPLGPIIGGALGGVAIICLTVLGIFILRRRRTNSRPTSRVVEPENQPHPPSYVQNTVHDKHSNAFEVADNQRGYPYELYNKRATMGPFEASNMNRDPVELPGHHGRC